MAFSVALARLLGFVVALVLSVIYTGLFVAAIAALRKRQETAKITRAVPAVLVVVFLLNTTQLSLQAADIYRAFFVYENQPGGPVAYFNDCASRILPVRDSIFWALGLITDALLIWRLYVICLRKAWVTVLPVIFLAAEIGCGAVMLKFTIGRMYEDSMALSPEIDKWWLLTLGFSIVVNVLTPGMIIARLLWIANKLGILLHSPSSKRYRQIVLVLGESGSLYLVAIVTHMVIFSYGSLGALYFSGCIMPPIFAIVPTLVILGINRTDKHPVIQFQHMNGEAHVVTQPGHPPEPEANSGVHVRISRWETVDDTETPSQKTSRPDYWSTDTDVESMVMEPPKPEVSPAPWASTFTTSVARRSTHVDRGTPSP